MFSTLVHIFYFEVSFDFLHQIRQGQGQNTPLLFQRGGNTPLLETGEVSPFPGSNLFKNVVVIMSWTSFGQYIPNFWNQYIPGMFN